MRQSRSQSRSKSGHQRNPSSERKQSLRAPLLAGGQDDNNQADNRFVTTRQARTKKADPRDFNNAIRNGMFAINDSHDQVATHKSRLTGSRVQSKQHIEAYYAPPLSETTEGGEPRYFTDQKRVLHHAELKENLNELHLSGQVNNQIEKEVLAKEEEHEFFYDEQELEHQPIKMNYPAKEVERMVGDFKNKIPDLKQKQITQYLENYKNIRGVHRTPDFKVCVHIHGNEINFVHSTHYVVVHEDELRLVTLGTVKDRTRYDSAGYKLYLLMHRIYFEPRCAISREPIFQTELTSFENDKFIDTRCKLFYQVADHIYFYKVETHMDDDFKQNVSLMKINFVDERPTPVVVPEYSFQYKLMDKDEQAKHNLVSHVIFQTNIRYDTRKPERQKKEMDDEYSTEEQLKEQIVQIAFDAKVDNINSKLGVAYGFAKIKDAGQLLKIKTKSNSRETHTFFHEIQNQRDQEGEPKLNFSFLGKVKKGSDEFCWISNGQLLRKFKLTEDDEIQEITAKKELAGLETGAKGDNKQKDFLLSDKVQNTIKYQNQQIVKILEKQHLTHQDEEQEQKNHEKDVTKRAASAFMAKIQDKHKDDPRWLQSTFNWHTNKEFFFKQAQYPDHEHDQDDEYNQYFEEKEEDIGMTKTEGKKGIPVKLSGMNACFLIELFDQSQFCVISKQANPNADGEEYIQIRKYEEIDQDIYINSENQKIQGHPFVKLLVQDKYMNLNQVKSSCGNVFVRLKDKQIVQADRAAHELTALGHVTHQDEATDIPDSLKRFRENNQQIRPIAQTYNIPFIQVKEHVLADEIQENGCITKKRRVLHRPVITFLDKHMQVLTKAGPDGRDDVQEMLNIYNIQLTSAKQLKKLKQALSSHVYVFNNEYVQHFQVVNKINNDGLCWYIIQEFMFNLEGSPNPRLIAIKVLLTDLEKQGHMYFSPLYEGDDEDSYNSFICGTQLFYNKGVKEIAIQMKNLESDEYQIRNEVSSNSYKSYIIDQEHLDRSEDKTKYLIVEARVSEAMRANIHKTYKEGTDKGNVQFTQNEVFATLWNQVTITLNMYPLQGLDAQLFGDLKRKDEFDIFQPLELLRGKSLSCLMVQDANWFNHELERIRKAQKRDHCPSIVDDYLNDKPEMRLEMEKLDLIRRPYEIVKDLQDESILITCLRNEETSQTFKLLMDYLFDCQRRSQGGYTILMQTMTYIMDREEDDIEYPSSYMRFFNDGEQYNLAVKIDNLDGIMPEYIKSHEHMINYKPKHPALYLRYIGDHKESRDELCHAVKHRLEGQAPREAVDHTIIDFSLIETHAKLKKLKNTSETLMDRVSNQVLGAVHDSQFPDLLHDTIGSIGLLKADRSNFPINEFEREFPFIDRYAISQIAWKFNCFYGDQIETQQSMKAIVRHMYIKTRKAKAIHGVLFAIFFVAPFVVQLNTLDYEVQHDHDFTRFCMWLCLAYQVMQAIMSILLIKAGGWTFFHDTKNNADLVMVILYIIYINLALRFSKDGVISLEKNSNSNYVMSGADSWISALLVGILFLALFQLAKFCEIYRRFSLLTRMFTRCVSDVAPFTVFLITWNLFFAMSFRLMGVVMADSMFPNLVPFFQYFTGAFENSMGAISTPAVSTSAYSANYSWGMIHVVWFIWFANQFVVTIILMNLLIAVLGDTYANITSNQSQIRFNEEATMNRAHYHLVHAGVNSSCIYKLFDGKTEQHHPISLLSFKIEPKSMNEWAGVSSKIVGEIRLKFDSLLKHVLKIKREQQDQTDKQEKNNETFKAEVLAMLHSIKDKQEEQEQQLEQARTLQTQNSLEPEQPLQREETNDFERQGTMVNRFDAATEDREGHQQIDF